MLRRPMHLSTSGAARNFCSDWSDLLQLLCIGDRERTMANKKKMTMGVIVGNRGFFPDHLAKSGREEMIQALQTANIDAVVLGPEQSKYGVVETYDEAKRCAELFKSKADQIDGVIVTLPNFGDERAIADALRLSRLNV